MDKDIVIIGGGPGGYVAAIRAAQLGAKVTLIEKDKLGGTCLNRGCIPTKTLYRNAEILNTLKNISEFGINVSEYTIDVNKIQERKRNVVTQLTDGIAQLLKANGVEVIKGLGKIKDKNTVAAYLDDGTEKEITTKNIIIATGSRPFIPPIKGINLDGVVTSEDLLEFDKIPNKLLIIGGGVIGMEFACIFNALGSRVTVVEYMPNILMQVDSDLTKRLMLSLKKRGIEIFTSTKVNKIEKNGNILNVFAEGKKGDIVFEADTVLVSVGRSPVLEDINIKDIGIKYDRKGIKVDENYMTNVEGIYAIGDVNGISMLAHAASHQGILVVEKIMGVKKENHMMNIPACVFVFPEIATIGISEDEAKEKGISYKTSKFLFGANGKALALGETEGMLKVIASAEDNKILGVHIMGPHASDLIHEGVLAIGKKMTCKDISQIVHAHPTLSEAFVEAVMGINGEAIHMISNKR